MPLQSINPASDDLVREYPEASSAEVDAILSAAATRLRDLAPHQVRRALVCPAPQRGLAAREEGDPGAADGGRDGQAAGAGPRRGREVCERLRLLRHPRRALPGPGARGDRGGEELRGLRAARPGARRDAVELPAVAGVPLRGARPDGREHGVAQARFQRHRLRPGDRGDPARGRPAEGRLPGAARALAARRRHHRRPRGRRGHADRQHARGPRRGRPCRRLSEEDGAGAGRQRRLRGSRRRRPGPRRRDLRRLAADQRRPELHRRQALRGGRTGGARVRGAARGADEGPAHGRPAGRGYGRRAAGAARPARRAAPAGAGRASPAAPACAWAAPCPRAAARSTRRAS